MNTQDDTYRQRPAWLKKRLVSGDDIFGMKDALSRSGANTVCELSSCPNLNECFSQARATFMILGRECTRSCAFCSAGNAGRRLEPVDHDEPRKILDVVKTVGLKYVVITSVTRDDLEDRGAGQFIDVMAAIKMFFSGIRCEVLVPDLKGEKDLIKAVLRAGCDVFGHNIETVDRLYPEARQGADYKRSLDVLRTAREAPGGHLVKSSIMVGLGEAEEEVVETIKDIRVTGCDILTIGQYLSPGRANLPVKRFAAPDEFERYRETGARLGFKHVFSGPFVRSSYFAEESYDRCKAAAHC